MDTLIQNLQYADKTIQALAVSAGGLIGVFATLAVFFGIIAVSNLIAKRKPTAD